MARAHCRRGSTGRSPARRKSAPASRAAAPGARAGRCRAAAPSVSAEPIAPSTLRMPVPSASDCHRSADRLDGRPMPVATKRRQQHERQARRQSSARGLSRAASIESGWPDRTHLLHRAVLEIGTKQQLEREQRCEQRGDPQDAGRDAAKLSELRVERERKQRRDDHEEDERLRNLAPVPERQHEVAPVREPGRGRGCRGGS